MNISQNVPLAKYSGMGVGGAAAYFCEAESKADVIDAITWAQSNNLPIIMIGYGSNVLWRDGIFNGLVIVNKILGYEVFQEDETNFYITIGAGENWDSVVERSVQAGLTGIEAMSLIPGTVGATPIQNVGAYGQDISQTLVTLEAYDSQAHEFVTLPISDCELGYRTSRFKSKDRGRFFITHLTLHLNKANPAQPFYPAVQSYFEANNISEFTPTSVRKAVIYIRSSKLPDPKVVPNNGSFFYNPVISSDQYAILSESNTNISHWDLENDQVKVSAAWLIEQAGFKNFKDETTGMATWQNQPLVLVNEHAKSATDVLAFKQKIVDAVNAKFGIILEQEPELFP